MQIHYLRDIPLALGIIALLIGIFRNLPDSKPNCSETNPQWMCRAVFYFVGSVLICFGVLGNYFPH